MTMVESWTPRLVTRSIFISAISLGLRSSGLKAVARRASSSGFRRATPEWGAEEAWLEEEEGAGEALDVDTMMYLQLDCGFVARLVNRKVCCACWWYSLANVIDGYKVDILSLSDIMTL